ncbi:hypothetical protein [Desulfosoma caldarium]|uniref:Multidrug transporter n=1 Tax=Desulfosoma caldarium TaxID=610254 RepID=A0A3N1UJ63_9BACT|nr:hypothetical protein [Desulfosoma caldarium]ROQ89808.1 hypothetical protein EDC27_2920 [Desulfosoma caldarium]
MKRWGILWVCAMALAGVLMAWQPVWAENPGTYAQQKAAESSPDGGIMLADVLIARPIGIAACAVGLVGTVIALPFAAFSGSVDAVTEKLVAEPFAYTFQRPLGQFPGELTAR